MGHSQSRSLLSIVEAPERLRHYLAMWLSVRACIHSLEVMLLLFFSLLYMFLLLFCDFVIFYAFFFNLDTKMISSGN